MLGRMARHAARYGAPLLKTTVSGLRYHGDRFLVDADGTTLVARSVLLATGTSDHRPFADKIDPVAATLKGSLRYCPVCDGFEARGKRVAVLGGDKHGAAEALFLRTYVSDLTLLALHTLDLTLDDRRKLAAAGISVAEQPVTAMEACDGSVYVTLEGGTRLSFEILYAALGCTPRTGLALGLGAATTPSGCLVTNDHMETTVPGLFAAGDVVEGLDQISVAAGQAAIAATAIHRKLAARWWP
jgi:thioredoxin reductase (NADPH)